MADVRWVEGDTVPPLDLTVQPLPDGLALGDADLTVRARSGVTVVEAAATALDESTVRVSRDDLVLPAGQWDVEVSAVWGQTVRTWPDHAVAMPRVSVRPRIEVDDA